MSSPPTLDFKNIQGDVLQGLPKRVQTFIFFSITNPTQFRQRFKAIIPFITTTAQALADQAAIAAHKASGIAGLLPLAGTNVAFSSSGLVALGITDDLGDPFFKAGQLADAVNPTTGLSDPLVATGDPDWDAEFKQTIHGVLLITGDSQLRIDLRKVELEAILIGTTKVVATVNGAVRPGPEAGHEHFGFQDGLSQPPVTGFRAPNTGEDPVDPGVILIGENGDKNTDGTVTVRPAWAKDSSFLVFRKLKQLVPEFNDFLAKNPIPDPGLTPAQGSELLGARLVGRWKSGAPIDKDPVQDNPADTSPNTVNNFDYSDDPREVRCPFSAHLRKMNPRNSAVGAGGLANVRIRRIIRQGIPYGPEVTKPEADSAKTTKDRGLLFTCYQSSVERGFHFLQRSWANNTGFPPIPAASGLPSPAGFDPIIGQSANGQRSVTGTDPQNAAAPLQLPPAFVVSRGGEYFLSPTISALKTKIAAA